VNILLTLGSLFNGIGTWILSGQHAGIKTLWESEFDEFPEAVSHHHFPDVKQLGDITKIKAEDLEPVDIICAGSPCFVAGTSILTHDGMKAVEDVRVGNVVLGDDCKWHKVVKTMVSPANVIYTIKAQGLLETKVTANHPIYVKHMKRYYPHLLGEKRGNYRRFSKAEYVAVKDLEKGDFIGFPILNTSENKMNITAEEAWLIGRYIADGYINNSQRSGRPKGQLHHKVIYCIGKDKLDNFKAHVGKYHVCLKKDLTVTKGEVVSERLMDFCHMCGRGAGNKEIPGVFLNLPKDLLKSLLDGYMSGDGCRSKGVNKATTISKNLALSLQVAVHKVYEVPVKIYFSKRPPKAVIQGREINQHDTYQVSWLDQVPKQSQAIVEDGYIWQPIRQVTKEEVKTSVYNFEVEGVHSYTANGMMVHNCQDLSVAGKMKGLEGERSGLFHTAIRLVHELRERTGKPRFFIWENVCFTEGTFVTTDKGLKEIQDVKEGDMVLTKSDEYCPVVKKHTHKDKETVVISACGTEPLTVTPNHPFWVRHNKHTQPRSFTAPEWIPAGQLKKDDWIGYKTDGYGIIRIGLPFAYAVGRWLADGSIVDRGEKRGSRGGQRFRIFISTGYKKYEHLKSKLSELPYKICENKMEHAINFTFTSDEFAKLIEQCGRGASNKKVPAWVYALSYKEQKELLQGYLDGDGHIRRGNEVSYCTTSRQLAYGMARLVRNVYHVGCSITKRKSTGKAIIEGRIVNAKDSYDCCFNIPSKKRTSNGSFYEDGVVWCKVKGVANGKREMVFNISVSGDNTFCANGIIVHNCGAFSTNKGHDFRAVLEEITKTEIPMPTGGRWAESGMVEWNGGSLAWRVLDAQYWGVPQRRKRIFLVADFGGKSAGEILFERKSSARDSAESEREGQEAAGNVGKGVDSASETLITCYNVAQPANNFEPYVKGGGVSPTLISRMGTGGNQVPIVHSVSDSASGIGYQNCAVLRMRSGCAGGGKGLLVSNEKSLTLATSNDQTLFTKAYCLAGNTIDRQPQNGGNGTGNQEELSYTLNTVDRHAVAECFPQNAYDKFLQGPPLTTLKASGGSYGGGSESLILEDSYRQAEGSEVFREKADCLTATYGTKWNGNAAATNGSLFVKSGKSVRRLTPTECERLQGLPDGYTDIEFNGKPAPDSRRYKAIGNGMAVPCSTFIMRRIAEVADNGKS
jgi:site-specific DNA-cytosine methylase